LLYLFMFRIDLLLYMQTEELIHSRRKYTQWFRTIYTNENVLT